MKKSSGYTLIELLLVVMVSLSLISFIFDMYLASQRGYQLQSALYHLQDNAKTAINLIHADLQKIRQIGCLKLTNDFPTLSYASCSLTPQTTIVGKDEEIMIQYAEFPNVMLLKPLDDQSVLYVSNEIAIHDHDMLIISDCKQAEMFQVDHVVTSKNYQKIVTSLPLHGYYDDKAEVSHFIKHRYFIDKTSRLDKKGLPIYSLFVEDANNKIELVEGIKKMKFNYSILNKDKLIELPANEINDWSKVIGVAMELTIESYPLSKTWYHYSALVK